MSQDKRTDRVTSGAGASVVRREALLKIEGLKTWFHTEEGVAKAVDGVTYTVRKGETLGVVGESGCGKSVTALSVMQLVPMPPGKFEGGRVLFRGEDLLEKSLEEMQEIRGNDIAMIFQEPMSALNPVYTVGDQIMETVMLHQGLDKAAAREHAIEMLKKVGIPSPEQRVDEYPHQLSGGMRQRVMIAMGLACLPKLLIADEPTTALDVTVQAQILELLRDLVRANNSSMMLITHDLGVVARYADRINVMYAGRIVERGTAEEIFHYPKHPYTLGLMESMPRLDQAPGSRLTPIPGQPPDLSDPPPGCPFHPRCRFAEARCRSERPPLEQITDNHWKACWVDTDAKR